MVYKIVIIGLGISGLSISNKLTNYYDNKEMCILEASNRVGGRIYTQTIKIKKKEIKNYELGAGRFCKAHYRLCRLINNLNLEDKIIPNKNNVDYVIKNKKIKNIGTVFDIYSNAIKEYNEYNHEKINLTKYTFDTLGKHLVNKGFLSLEKYNWSRFSFPYDSEFNNMNAEVLFFNLKGQSKYPQFFSLKDGLSQISKGLYNILIKKGYSCLLNNRLIEFQKMENGQILLKIDDNGIIKSIKTEKLVLAIPPNKVLDCKNNILPKYLTNSIGSFSLYRIYAIFPMSKKTGKVWFNNINRTITDNPLRYIIPIDKKKGLIMISYVTGHLADYVTLHFSNNKKLVNYIMLNLKKLYPNIAIPKPIWIGGKYWPIGVHYYYPGFNPVDCMNYYLKPTTNPVWLIGEAYSEYQGWIEGSLQTSELCLKQIIDY